MPAATCGSGARRAGRSSPAHGRRRGATHPDRQPALDRPGPLAHPGFAEGAKRLAGFGLVLDWLSRDPGTSAILLDVREIKDRRGFMSAARAAARLRPVVCIRPGGRLADPSGRADAVFEAALRRAGILRVTELEELLVAAETLAHTRPARGEAVAIVTNAIGPGRMAADAALAADVPLAAFSPETVAALRALLPQVQVEDGGVYVGADSPARVAEAASALSAAR